ncbi:MAG TPA: T9SS type A sorting domain-containing protein, partial [Bacteroidota bacterium]|nr:T9SS type A sorting domain-containing protein [Bacteroidota bacterium]
WDENITGPLNNGNRNFFVPATDTVLLPEFWNNGHFTVGKNPGVFDVPWAADADSFLNVYFRVNIRGVQDGGTYGYTAADQDSVCVMGDGKGGPDLDWGTPYYMTQEQSPTNSANAFGMAANTFFNGRVRFRKSQVTAGEDVAYKFRFGSNWNYGSLQRSEQLGSQYAGGNRHFSIPQGLKDTTLMWVYFGDATPIARANPDTCLITWVVDLANTILKGGYTPGDTVEVQSGFFNTAAQNGRNTVLTQVIGSIYSATDTVVTKVGAILDYQYYAVKFGVTNRENYYNYTYNGGTASEAERRQINVGSKSFIIVDTSNSIVSARRQPLFPSTRKLARNVKVTFTVDLRPAYYNVLRGDTLNAIQGETSVIPGQQDSIFKWGVWINGPALNNWDTWGLAFGGLEQDTLAKMWDDGTHGDKVAHDSIYSVVILHSPDSVGIFDKGVVGQVFKFGIRGSDNEGGEGGYGNNHAENIVDTDTTYTIASDFGSINPAYYKFWNYDTHKYVPSPLSVKTEPGIVTRFALEQNYPNPFNPSTRIQFSIAKASMVQLKVYNILGQEVTTLVNEPLVAGVHTVTFDASRYASGVYLYKIVAGSFITTKKMLLLK